LTVFIEQSPRDDPYYPLGRTALAEAVGEDTIQPAAGVSKTAATYIDILEEV
jgi:hypothetical protein